MKPRQQSGFTLLELLVVMTIIAILASALLAGLSGARQSAMKKQGNANARLIANACTMYYNTYGNWPVTAPTPIILTTNVINILGSANPRGISFLETTKLKVKTSSATVTDPMDNTFYIQTDLNGLYATGTPVRVWSTNTAQKIRVCQSWDE